MGARGRGLEWIAAWEVLPAVAWGMGEKVLSDNSEVSVSGERFGGREKLEGRSKRQRGDEVSYLSFFFCREHLSNSHEAGRRGCWQTLASENFLAARTRNKLPY